MKFGVLEFCVKMDSLHGSLVYPNTESFSEIKIPVSEIGGAGVYFVKVNSMVKKLVVVEKKI